MVTELHFSAIRLVREPGLFPTADMYKRLIHLGAWLLTVLIRGAFLTPLRSIRPPDLMPFYFGGKLATAGRISQICHEPAYPPLISELRATGERMSPVEDHYLTRPAFPSFFYTPFTCFFTPEGPPDRQFWRSSAHMHKRLLQLGAITVLICFATALRSGGFSEAVFSLINADLANRTRTAKWGG